MVADRGHHKEKDAEEAVMGNMREGMSHQTMVVGIDSLNARLNEMLTVAKKAQGDRATADFSRGLSRVGMMRERKPYERETNGALFVSKGSK